MSKITFSLLILLMFSFEMDTQEPEIGHYPGLYTPYCGVNQHVYLHQGGRGKRQINTDHQIATPVRMPFMFQIGATYYL